MANKVKCPCCGSYKTSTTIVGGIEKVGAGIAAAGAAILGGLLNPNHAGHLAHTVSENIPHQYKCDVCGHTWHK